MVIDMQLMIAVKVQTQEGRTLSSTTLKPAHRYSLIDPDAAHQKSRLAKDARALDVWVRGTQLESQFELGDGSALLWITENSPYDEALHVYLLGIDGKIGDALEASATFMPAILQIMNFGNAWVEFMFFKNEVSYRLDIMPNPQFRFLSLTGWRYEKPFRRHRLSLSCLS
jgi:hypothetical protein